jgi:hypothetical protein
MSSLVQRESPTEYFKGLVDSALANQSLEASEFAAFYLVNLLCGFMHVDPAVADGAFGEDPLAFRLGRALEAGGSRRRAALRQVGDASLFVAGYFSDSLRTSSVDVDYYAALGGYAYRSLGRCSSERFAGVFDELAGKFIDFADVLSEVSERSGLTSNTDLLRLYEKWLRTGSTRHGQTLVGRGIVPNASIGKRFLQ